MNRFQPRILIADDQEDVLAALRILLKPEGFALESVTSPPAVLQALDSREFDVLLMDLNYTRDTTSGQEGLDLLNRILQTDPTLPVVVMTAWGSVDIAVEAMRRGARISFRNLGTTRGCSRFSRRRLNSAPPCGAGPGWKPKTNC